MRLESWMRVILGLCSDSSELVRLRVIDSLQELGHTKRKRVLLFLRKFLTEHQCLPLFQRITLLKSIFVIAKDSSVHLGRPLSKKLISLALTEMTKLSNVTDGHRETASNLLLILGCSFPTEVFTELQTMIHRQIPANFYVILTLANLSCENVYCIVPLLKPLMEKILFMLQIETCERIKWVFCYAFSLFSKSILTYISDSEKTPHPPLRKNAFYNEFSAAYDVFFHYWLKVKESKVNVAVVEAIGQISYLLPNDKVENELPALIPTILSMYQKTVSDLSVTKAMCGILQTTMERDSKMLVAHLDCLLMILHQQVCITMNQPTSPLSEAQRNKLLCCFKLLTPAFIDQLLTFLFLELEISDEQILLGALAIMNYLISNIPSCLESQRSQILMSLALPMTMRSNRVKGILAQVIHTMATQGYLELNRGVELIEFIIEQCALPTVEDKKGISIGERREDFSNVIIDRDVKRQYEKLVEELTTTLNIDNLLWPLLLEFVIPVRYTNALALVCGSLVYLGKKKQEAGATEFVLNYEEHVNLPNCQALLTRLLTVASSPYEGNGQGIPALSLLQVLGINIHPAAVKVWDKELPILTNYLQEFPGNQLLQNQWEEKLLHVLCQTLEEIEDEVWIVQLSEMMSKYLYRFYPTPQQKGFLYKCLGIVLQLTQNQEMVKKKLHEMFQIVCHGEDLEREGAAIGIGQCSHIHLDISLTMLKNCSRLNIFKKTASFYQIMKDQGSIEVMKVKSTLILSYGYVIWFSQKELILPRLETDILQNVLNHFNMKILGMKVQVKDTTMKLSLIKAITLMAKVILPVKDEASYKLARKAELVSYLQDFIKAEPRDTMRTSIRKAAIDACAVLVIVEPLLSDHTELVRVCLNSVFSLPYMNGINANESKDMNIAKKQELYNETLASLENFLKQFLIFRLSPDGLQFLFKNMMFWIESKKNYEREKSLEMALHLLNFYLEETDINDKPPSHNLAAVIGYIVLRCSDPSIVVREKAIECLYLLLQIQLQLERLPRNQTDEEVKHLKAIKDGLKDTSSDALYCVCTDIGKVLSRCMPHNHVDTLLFSLSEGLSDEQLNGSFVASIVMNVLIRKCGAILNDIPGIIKVLYDQLQSITEPRIIRAVMHIISILASQNVLMILPFLLKYQIPFRTYNGEVWQSLLNDNVVAKTSVKYLLDNLKLLYDDRKERFVQKTTRSITQQPFVVMSALHAMICSPKSESVINILYPQLFCTILIYLSSSVQIWYPSEFPGMQKDWETFSQLDEPGGNDVFKYAVEILQALLKHGKTEGSNVAKMGSWGLIKSPEKHHKGVMLLASAMATCAVPHLISIVEQLIPFLANVHEKHRITIAAFFAELLNHPVMLELSLTDTLVTSLLRSLIDTSPTVQCLALKGLGNVGASQKVEKYSIKLLSAMIAMIHKYSETNKFITVEAMSSISKILDQLQGRLADSILVDVALTIQPLFEHKQDQLRTTAFKVHEKIIQFIKVQPDPALMEHLHSTLISLLLHLNDDSQDVRKACKSVLHSMGPIMATEGPSTMLQELSLEEPALDYEAYLSEIAKQISKELPDKVTFYIASCAAFFKSVQPEIRENAVTLIGLLMYNAAPDYSTFSVDPICEEINTLLFDPVKSVRLKAAEAVQYLYMY
ncbi:maestro heat-like repeat-containing protein family member 1 [Chiloscyllium plagiosum]|uniref:maestro heat-like repeat-containing protein family member 1 n=1 Tax=Chiloscyllium plagiosum TaxID=36176 RepID=UPI001CB80EFC|nr:maestro heat-like repeat-containing protein family member 1 [Chiloscyllium plagiosum]